MLHASDSTRAAVEVEARHACDAGPALGVSNASLELMWPEFLSPWIHEVLRLGLPTNYENHLRTVAVALRNGTLVIDAGSAAPAYVVVCGSRPAIGAVAVRGSFELLDARDAPTWPNRVGCGELDAKP